MSLDEHVLKLSRRNILFIQLAVKTAPLNSPCKYVQSQNTEVFAGNAVTSPVNKSADVQYEQASCVIQQTQHILGLCDA